MWRSERTNALAGFPSCRRSGPVFRVWEQVACFSHCKLYRLACIQSYWTWIRSIIPLSQSHTVGPYRCISCNTNGRLDNPECRSNALAWMESCTWKQTDKAVMVLLGKPAVKRACLVWIWFFEFAQENEMKWNTWQQPWPCACRFL